MRIMGLDVGEKRIGIAISDPLGWTAQGHSVLQRKSKKVDFTKIQEICVAYQVEKIVVGLPRNMNGTEGPKALEVRDFAASLQEFLQLPLDFWDERLTTQSAERVLIDADVSRSRRKKVIDKMAAINILQGYLDRQSRS
ncbi:MAG: Holliday junction resolvase RuvX [Syntrophomonadaceae bacterium]|jgi:putative Holliday junction resolvase